MPKISYERMGEYVRTALQLLEENDDSLPSREVVERVGKRLAFNEYELEKYEKSGYIRWEAILHFYSIDAVKAGWLIKKQGVWYITDTGKDATRLSNIDFFQEGSKKYKEWKGKQPTRGEDTEELSTEDENFINPQITFDQAQSNANQEIETFVLKREPYEFQELVAALLKGMGYHTPFVSPKGRDGGIDVLAYSDPLGTTAPRITVQVKQRPDTKATVQELRELGGLLRREGDIGLFVSTGGFTKEAVSEASNAVRHMETIDLHRFIHLWKTHYKSMSEEDRALLPLREIMFLAPTD